MKRLKPILIAAAFAALFSGAASAQTYVKLNALYALAGVINPQVEMQIAPHSSLSFDLTYSPWRSVMGRHFHFGMLAGEYRYYFKPHGGWYVSANVGMNIFDISKPRLFENGRFLYFAEGYGKGCGLFMGVGFGYRHAFAERWVVDAFVAGDWFCSWYNGYSAEGKVNDNPNPQWNAKYPDPYNGSGEILPAKIGVSIGYMILKPKR